MHSRTHLTAGLMLAPLDDASALSLLAQAPTASWRQFPAYSKVAAQRAGAQSCYVAVRAGKRAIALANLRVKPLPFLPMGIAMIAQGPVMLAGFEDRREEVIEALQYQFACKRRLNLRINLPVDAAQNTDVPAAFLPINGSEYETFLIDLGDDLETLRARLNGKWRTDLRRGEKSDLRVERSNNPDDFRKFQPLLSELASSKGFAAPQDAEFFAEVASHAQAPEEVAIHLAWSGDRLVSGHIGAYSGDMAVYLLGASNDEGRNLRASFLLQWRVMEFAKSRGMRCYDLGGADELDNPHVFRFKKRMGGTHFIGAPMIEAKAGWPSGMIVSQAEWLYSKLRARG